MVLGSGERYEDATRRIWSHGNVDRGNITAVQQELVRYSTLAPSSHNTQCWKFVPRDKLISIQPDYDRRCPAVDPDDHHLFVSLGCAAENLVQAASAIGFREVYYWPLGDRYLEDDRMTAKRPCSGLVDRL